MPLAASSLGEREAIATAKLFKALADPARVRIVNTLATNAERCVRVSSSRRSPCRSRPSPTT